MSVDSEIQDSSQPCITMRQPRCDPCGSPYTGDFEREMGRPVKPESICLTERTPPPPRHTSYSFGSRLVMPLFGTWCVSSGHRGGGKNNQKNANFRKENPLSQPRCGGLPRMVRVATGRPTSVGDLPDLRPTTTITRFNRQAHMQRFGLSSFTDHCFPTVTLERLSDFT